MTTVHPATVPDGQPAVRVRGLAPWHASHLRQAGISEDVIASRGYRSVNRPSRADESPRELLQRCGIPGSLRKEDARYPGLLIPLYRATGERISWQYRPDVPGKDPRTGKPQRYVAQAGRPSVLDVHPVNRDRIIDPAVDLWITEGVKKGDALTTAGACVITLAGVFSWRRTHGTLGDWEDVPLKGRQVNICFDADARTNPNVARAMGRLGKWLDSKGAKGVRYIVVPAKVGDTEVKGADDYLAAGGTLGQLLDAAASRPPELPGSSVGLSDAELAGDLAVELLDGAYCWTAALDWMAWDGRRWRRTPDQEVREQARLWVLAKHEAAMDAAKAAAREGADAGPYHGLAAAWYKYLARSRIEAIVALAQGIVLYDAADFDTRRDLLNVANGVVDLRTGELMPHDPGLLMTKLAPVAYHPDARHEDWGKALQAIPEDVREWAQVRYGQAITGHMTPDDQLILQVGTGENGKTTVMAALAAALGDYFLLVSHRAILGDAKAHPTELMDFRGARLALLEELPEEGRVSITRIKALVGTPLITARHCNKDDVTFEASHGLFISTNYLPVVEQTDHGTWRRFICLRFPYRFLKPGEEARGPEDKPGDPGLRERLRSGERGEHEAALAWLVAGAVKWYAAEKVMPGLPSRIEKDTTAWRKQSDLILAYLDDRIVFSMNAHVIAEELLADFNDWAESRGQRAWSNRTFAERFSGHGEIAANRVEKTKTRPRDGLSRRPSEYGSWPGATTATYHAWFGLKFRTSGDPLPDDDASDQGKADHVPGVPGPGTANQTPRAYKAAVPGPGTPGTSLVAHLCEVCGTPLDPVLTEAGITTHPCCEPPPGAWPDGSHGEGVNQPGSGQPALIPAVNGYTRNQPKRQPRNQRHGKTTRYPS